MHHEVLFEVCPEMLDAQSLICLTSVLLIGPSYCWKRFTVHRNAYQRAQEHDVIRSLNQWQQSIHVCLMQVDIFRVTVAHISTRGNPAQSRWFQVFQHKRN